MKHYATSLIVGLVAPVQLFAQERPNIIYIMTDQQSATAMSCVGNEDLHTPNIVWQNMAYVLRMLTVPFL